MLIYGITLKDWISSLYISTKVFASLINFDYDHKKET